MYSFKVYSNSDDKTKTILAAEANGWRIQKKDQPQTQKSFSKNTFGKKATTIERDEDSSEE